MILQTPRSTLFPYTTLFRSIDDARKRRDEIKLNRAKLGSGRGSASVLKARKQADRALESAETVLRDAIPAARSSILKAMTMLDKLVDLQPSMERESLYGSAYKRLALIQTIGGLDAA